MKNQSSTERDTDFHAWALRQARLLRSGRYGDADMVHVIEELEDLGASIQRELESRLAVLLAHLLKWRYQSERQSHSWRYTIREQRRRIDRLLRRNPSVRSRLPETLTDAYEDAVLAAARDTGLEDTAFPATLPWTAEQVLSDDFWPEA